MVQLYILNCDIVTDQQYRFLYQKVSLDRRQRADRFRLPISATHCVCGELLVRFALSQVLAPVKPDPVTFLKEEKGKPYNVEYPCFHYNLSHSQRWLVCATACTPVGVDVEHMAPKNLNLSKAIFSSAEQQRYHLLPEERKEDFFYRIWTGKESYLKYIGCGINLPLKNLSIHEPVVFHLNKTAPGFLAYHNIDPEYRFATFSEDETSSSCVREVTIPELEEL